MLEVLTARAGEVITLVSNDGSFIRFHLTSNLNSMLLSLGSRCIYHEGLAKHEYIQLPTATPPHRASPALRVATYRTMTMLVVVMVIVIIPPALWA